jgi:hypothetical protein
MRQADMNRRMGHSFERCAVKNVDAGYADDRSRQP